MKKMALYFENLEDKVVRCLLCPHKCILKDGNVGICGVRKNEKGLLMTLNYGEISSIAMDPIEKKPLFHFNPGDMILSIGTFGCNMKC
ncbi:MAG TPA: AmmeMemoRadiSam system radical SAM enzyme, partial [Thermotoga sp.]|nr:AmmeMemoRadiSam system radical SAM enzyme [Thermotoga sp.]